MRVIVIGGGQVGSYLAGFLAHEDDVSLVECERSALARLRRKAGRFKVVAGSGTEVAALEAAGIQDAAALVAVTGSDEVNIVASMLAKREYNVARVIARVNNPQNAWMFTREMGVDVAVDQSEILSRVIRNGLDMRDMYALMSVGANDRTVIELDVSEGAPAVGRSLAELGLGEDVLVLAVARGDDVTLPHGDTTLLAGDRVIALVQGSRRDQLAAVLCNGAPGI